MTGRAIALKTGGTISPFNDPVSDSFIAQRTLAESQRDSFSACGLELIRAASPEEAIFAARGSSGPTVILLDRVYVSEKAAKDFLSAAKGHKLPAALTLSINASVEYTLPLQDVLREDENVVHDVFLVDPLALPAAEMDAIAWIRKLRASASRVLVKKREIVVPVPLPVVEAKNRQESFLRYPVTSTVVVSIEHWVHILWLNQIAFGIRWMELIRRHPLWFAWRAMTTFSLDRDRFLERLVKIGRRPKIHPTAYISGSILGDDVEIGAHATVRNSLVGSGTMLMDHAVLLNSVVGERCLVTSDTFVVSCAAYPEATIGNHKIQVCLLGRGSYVHSWAGFVDAKFVGHVKVNHHGALVSSERSFLGSVVGHRAKVAAKVLIQTGREIPNDTVIVMRPDEVVSVIPANIPPGRPMVRDRGTLVPLGEESR